MEDVAEVLGTGGDSSGGFGVVRILFLYSKIDVTSNQIQEKVEYYKVNGEKK